MSRVTTPKATRLSISGCRTTEAIAETQGALEAILRRSGSGAFLVGTDVSRRRKSAFCGMSVCNHHMAYSRVILKRIHRHVLAITRLLQAAVRHLVAQHEMRVDPRAAVLKRTGDLHCAADVAGLVRPH